jgi:capsid protein
VVDDQPRAGLPPLRLVPLEVEWLAEDPQAKIPAGHTFVRGIELDALGRPVRYHLRHPESGAPEVVPGPDIIHCFLRRRARQVHGEPEIASLVLRLWQDDEIVITELNAARNTAGITVALKTPDADLTDPNDSERKRRAALNLKPGSIPAIALDEELVPVENKRLTAGLQQFRTALDGDLAAGGGISRQWLDRDSARANYSSMREDQLRDGRRLAPARLALGRHLAGAVYERVAPLLFLGLGRILPSDRATRARLLRYELRPDQPPYVDPLKDAQAQAYQLDHDLITAEEIHAARGRSADQVAARRLAERQAADAARAARIAAAHEQAEALGIPGVTWRDLLGLPQGAAVASTPAQETP